MAPDNITLAHVPGSFELPVVAKSVADSGKFDAIICIGAVVRGATTHYEEVCSAATSGLTNAGLSSGASPPCFCMMQAICAWFESCI